MNTVRDIRVREARFHSPDMATRFPFKYGIASMTSLPHLFLTVLVETHRGCETGCASEGLAPKWFTKDPTTDPSQDLPAFGDVLRHAADTALALPPAASFFDFWRELYGEQNQWAPHAGHPPLLANLGVSLLERAVLDALCRQLEHPLHALVAANALGMVLGDIHPELRGRVPADFFARPPARFLECRHTVGLGDALEGPDDQDPCDGLPYSLDACVKRYGLRYFKIKLRGDLRTDQPRLEQIARVLDACIPDGEYFFTLDGNEQFASIEAFRSTWMELTAIPALHAFWQKLLFVEQPLHREVALTDPVRSAFETWHPTPPIIIDESDADTDSLPRALSLGYQGTSHKNCKGIIKGLANAALVAEKSLILSGEDLANVGPIALLQDLAMMALLHVGHVERNGHHYFRGLSMFSEATQQEVLRAHGDLYTSDGSGFATLSIRAGRIALDTVNAAGFGYAMPFTAEAFPCPGPWWPHDG